MADIRRLITDHGIDTARQLVTSKAERSALEAAYAYMSDESQELGIAHAGFALTSLPHTNPDRAQDPEYHRKSNNRCTLIIQSGRRSDGSLVGVPYGAKARMILLYLQTQAVRTNCRRVELGDNWHAWMKAMGERSAGGKTYQLVREQAQRITACSLQFIWDTPTAELRTNAAFVRNAISFKSTPADTRQVTLFQDEVELDETFFADLKRHPVPLSEAALRHISGHSAAIDIYIWLSYRLHVLEKPTPVRWHAVKAQFGEHYKKLSHLKPNFLAALSMALAVYPDARVDVTDEGLVLHPSRPPIAKIA
ncbi:replication protein RepA [Indioceanicola profundi]|uniref:replication protein RepA n=1 Tax=Indioceanicola profundi TaxID=2220096 RepID=UPI000E6ACFBE|nr:replication protein RepA [Indioceanicola profundi]